MTQPSITARLSGLPERGKAPQSASILTKWVDAEEKAHGMAGGQLRWLIAATVVTAALQRAVDSEARPRFRLKGGTYLRYLLDWSGRPTKDIDGIVAGDIESFLAELDEALTQPWGPLTLRRDGPIEVIATPARVIKPRRLQILVQLKGVTWQKVQVEISADEGRATQDADTIIPAGLQRFGLPNQSDVLFTIALRYQIAQKLHACTDPHTPPHDVNDRARDVVDLLLLQRFINDNGGPSAAELRDAARDIFDARAAEAAHLHRPPRAWPPVVLAHPHWRTDYTSAAAKAGLDVTLEEAVAVVNDWINQIETG